MSEVLAGSNRADTERPEAEILQPLSSGEAQRAGQGQAEAQATPGTVYIICAGDALKIGHTYGDPLARLATLQTGNARRLGMAAHWTGSRDEERELHERFANYRVSGEWFLPADELLIFLYSKRRGWWTGWEHDEVEDQCQVNPPNKRGP